MEYDLYFITKAIIILSLDKFSLKFYGIIVRMCKLLINFVNKSIEIN